MTTYEIYNLIIQIVATIFVGGGLVYAGKQVSLLVLTHNDNHDWNRRIATQNALRDFNNSVSLDELQKEFNFLNRKQPIPVEEITKAFLDKPDLQLQTHTLLNQYETFARGIFLGIYDEILIKNARKGSMERTFNSFKEYVQHRRNEVGSAAYIEYEKMLDKWHQEYKAQVNLEQNGKI